MHRSDYVPNHPEGGSGFRNHPLAVVVGDLVGAAMIAARLGYAHPQTVHTLRRRHAGFPVPVATLGRAHIWDWREVEEWAKATGRLP